MLSLTFIKRLFKPPLLLFVLYACQPLAEVAPNPTYTNQKPTAQWVPVASPAVQARLNALPAKGTAQSFKVGQGLNTHALATYNGVNVWYTMPLGQGSIAGWQNLVLGPTSQQSYVLHYQPASSYLLAPLEAFSGQVQVLNVSGTLLSSLTLQNGQLQASAAAGRAGANQRNMLNECVVDVHMYTEQQPVISNTTGLPVPGEVTQVTVVELVYGPCPIDSGGSSGGSNAGALPGGAGNEGGGTVQPGGPGGGTGTSGPSPTEPTPPDTTSLGVLLPSAALNQRILAHKLEENPFLLLDIPCDKIKDWQALAQHQVPQEVLQLLENLQADGNMAFTVQELADAAGPLVSLDEYNLTIKTLPFKGNGKRYQPLEFLELIRTSLPLHIDPNISRFSFYPGYEEIMAEKWSSENPVGTLFSIDFIVQGLNLESGSVACTNKDSSEWIFTTVISGKDFKHPVSGHRAFGININEDGSFTFYTRAVDRLTRTLDVLNEAYTGLPSKGADRTWNSLINSVNNFIVFNGGEAFIEEAVIFTPKWDDYEAVLNGEKSVEYLDDCN